MAANPAHATTIELRQGSAGYNGTTDSSIYQDNPANSSGGFPYIYIGRTQSASARRTLIRFDLTTHLPPSAIITSATLVLHVTDTSRPGNTAVQMHAITSNWVEGSNGLPGSNPGGAGLPAEPGDVTWSHASYTTTLWTNSGGDYTATATGSGSIGEVGTTAFLTGSGLATDIQTWHTTPASNFGWILIGNETGIGNAKRLFSSEAPANLQPTLFIEYTGGPATVQDWQLFQ